MRAAASTSIVAADTKIARFIPASIATFAHTALRVGAALLYMQHGAQKMFGWFGGMDGNGATAELFSLMGVAMIIEIFGGALIVLGLFTRPVAFLIVGEMLSAFAIAHLPQGGAPIQNGGEVPLLYALIMTFLVGHGPGSVSLDRKLFGRPRQMPAKSELD